MTLLTVGYEGTSIEEFTEFLKKNQVSCIADVRKNPVSRKKGFSKSRLAENLNAAGIEYIHMPGLGVPSAWRKLAKEEKITRKKMFRDYVKKILPADPEDLEKLEKRLKKKGLALLCYEAEAADCHRRYVAEELLRRQQAGLSLNKNNLRIKNLELPSQADKRLGRPSLFRRPSPISAKIKSSTAS